MSTDTRSDWIELGIRITKGIDALANVAHDPSRISAKSDALREVRDLHEMWLDVGDAQWVDADYEAAWNMLKKVLSISLDKARTDAAAVRTTTIRTYAEGYVQGIELALSYFGGFGR